MINCPNCKHQELEGTLFCSECGTQMIARDHLSTQSLRRMATSPFIASAGAPPTGPISQSQTDSEVVISLHFIDTGKVMHLSGQNEFTLGRIAEGQTAMPDIDLSSYEAYGQGVSRIHARLKVADYHVYITDLGSSNGTRVNGQKIAPQVEFPLDHGDMVALGKLKIQILIRK